ncbi:MAG: hypothetical protein Ct9H90mP9_0160 [Pseudomonadota bacterium]|nr:MAG: hypothetical protein Ct9H90mP9_0160 [Pseudomonadota bacterium]
MQAKHSILLDLLLDLVFFFEFNKGKGEKGFKVRLIKMRNHQPQKLQQGRHQHSLPRGKRGSKREMKVAMGNE